MSRSVNCGQLMHSYYFLVLLLSLHNTQYTIAKKCKKPILQLTDTGKHGMGQSRQICKKMLWPIYSYNKVAIPIPMFKNVGRQFFEWGKLRCKTGIFLSFTVTAKNGYGVPKKYEILVALNNFFKIF